MNQQRAMSNSSELVLSGPIMKLPVELLEVIYVLSETYALAHVCRSSYIALSSESFRLRFCTRLIYLDNSRKDPDQEGVRLRDEQSKIFGQEWFTVDFATKVKAAVKHIRVEDYISPHLSPIISSDTSSSIQTQLSLCFRGVYLPARLLRGPWSQSKFESPKHIFFWGLRTIPRDRPQCYQSMVDAFTIAQDKREAQRILDCWALISL